MEWYACYNQYQAKYFHPLKKVELNKFANKMSSIFKHVQWTFKLINALGILSIEGHQGGYPPIENTMTKIHNIFFQIDILCCGKNSEYPEFRPLQNENIFSNLSR